MKGVSYVIGSILMLIIVIALAGMAYMYIAGVFTATVQGIEIVDSFCEGGEVTMVIRNIGTTPITSLDIKQTSPTDDILTFPFQGTIDPGKTISYKDVCEGLTGRSCIYRIVPPIGKAATASAFCTTRPTSLVLSLHFDEGFGTTVTDKSGNGNDGTVSDPTNMWISTDCISGSCLSFDGSYDYVEIADSANLNITDEITIEVWVKPYSFPPPAGGWWGIVGKRVGHNVDSGYALTMGTYSATCPRWCFRINNDVAVCPSTACPEINQWDYIVGVYNGTHVSLYENGALKGTSSYSRNINPTANPLRIGHVIGYDYFNGIIDEVRIYNKAML